MTPLFEDDDPLGLPLQLHAMGVDVVADRVVWQGNHQAEPAYPPASTWRSR